MRILVVEDSLEVTRIVEMTLIAAGLHHTIVPAVTVAEAIRAVREQPPDLVLTNLALEAPMDGLEVIEFLGPSDIPVVLLTAYGQIPPSRYRGWGAAGCIAKPFTCGELLAGLAPFLKDRPVRDHDDPEHVTDHVLGNRPNMGDV